MQYIYHDGGRRAAGSRGDAGDCVTRAIAIITGRPYAEVYAEMSDINARTRKTKRRTQQSAGQRTARNGIFTKTKAFKDYMKAQGFTWTPTMRIGSGCKVHLADGELPMGRIIAAVSKHYTAIIDGVIHDSHDPQRDTRCVYGIWRFNV